MSFWVAGATGVGALVTAGAQIYSANAQAQAAQNASNSQSNAAQHGIDEQKRQFNQIQTLLKPYVDSGNAALNAQNDLNGINGPDAQQAAINKLQSSPEFAAMTQQGENSILQNASATGGLRGGNVQGALAQFRPAAFNQLLQQTYGRLGAQSSMGENAAAGVGNAGMSNAAALAGLYGQQGAAQAGAQIAGGVQQGQYANALSGAAGTLSGLNWGSLFGGGGPALNLPAQTGPQNTTGTAGPGGQLQ